MADVSKELRALWDQERPHFGGDAPHRYEFVGKGRRRREECVYCGRPRDYVPLFDELKTIAAEMVPMVLPAAQPQPMIPRGPPPEGFLVIDYPGVLKRSRK